MTNSIKNIHSRMITTKIKTFEGADFFRLAREISSLGFDVLHDITANQRATLTVKHANNGATIGVYNLTA